MNAKLFAAIAALTVTVPQFASAANGNITFNGKITPQTCVISGNGTTSTDFTVTLPEVSVSTLDSAGRTAGRTPFSIGLNCTPSTGSVHAYFEPGANVDTATGRLNVLPGGATNVQIGLLNAANSSKINLGAADAAQNSIAVPLVGGIATLNYYAEYVATGIATPGAAESSVMYTIVYQ
ncbi:fimbrial protein [Cupriavidus necator]|uniref:fimbrial protein n=1 Tax=Cupriavidus necator TaxID=106590 RepID=UPI0039C25488